MTSFHGLNLKIAQLLPSPFLLCFATILLVLLMLPVLPLHKIALTDLPSSFPSSSPNLPLYPQALLLMLMLPMSLLHKIALTGLPSYFSDLPSCIPPPRLLLLPPRPS